MRKAYFVVNERKFFVLWCLLGVSAALTACGKEDSVPGEQCAATVCKDANVLAVCDTQTGISFERECAYGCENNACKAAPVADKCTETVCKDANILAVCDAETGIIKERECADGCENNACKPKTGEDKCQDGPASCSADGAYAEKCEQGALWREQCANGCENGACKKQTIYKSGEKCDSETFNAYCLHDFNIAVTCDDDGEIFYEQCHSDEKCWVLLDDMQIGCFHKTENTCDNFGETVTTCKTNYNGWRWNDEKISMLCLPVNDGTGRLTEISSERCYAGCAADGVNCAPETTEDG